jgi:cysteine desulfurase
MAVDFNFASSFEPMISDKTTDPIYLDYNATTPVLPEVVDAMLPYLREHFGNPSSGHVFGQRAHEAVEKAREQVASLLRCWPEEVFFTSGGTEANNLAIRGAAAASDRRHIVTSSIEHPATEKPCAYLAAHGWQVSRMGVDAKGRVELSDAAQAITDETALVSVMHANNEVGTIQPVGELAEFAHASGALIHIDAAQSLTKLQFGVEDFGVDLMSIAGHKIYAPKGVGALFVREHTPIEPLVLGADHEFGLRPGTENVASIVGLGQACKCAEQSAAVAAKRIRGLRDDLWNRLDAAIEGIQINGDLDDGLPNTLNVRFPGVVGHELLEATPQIAASTGSACHDGEVSASSVLLAMGVPVQEALGSVRLSLGRQTRPEEIELAAQALIAAWNSAKTERVEA